MYIFISERLSHKDWRKHLKKQRRKLGRISIAKETERKAEEELVLLLSDPVYLAQQEEEEELGKWEEHEAERRRKEWRERDLFLHSQWLRNEEKIRLIETEKKKEEDKIRKEWEETLNKEEDAKVKLLEAQFCVSLWTCISLQNSLLEEASSQLGKEEVYHNPEPPVGYSRSKPKADPCPFFTKTGACRFGIHCSREHEYPERSRTILFPNMYMHFGLQGAISDDYDTDVGLEYTESETYLDFREFYFDVMPELETYGQVIQFKVCSNKCAHLRGNVYVQYESLEEAEKACFKLNGRWYAGKQISCVFVSVERWKPAICGLNFTNRCPKGHNCNFLHVFRNPGNAFFAADRDTFLDKSALLTTERHPSRSRDGGHTRLSKSGDPRLGSSKDERRKGSHSRSRNKKTSTKHRKSRRRSYDSRSRSKSVESNSSDKSGEGRSMSRSHCRSQKRRKSDDSDSSESMRRSRKHQKYEDINSASKILASSSGMKHNETLSRLSNGKSRKSEKEKVKGS